MSFLFATTATGRGNFSGTIYSVDGEFAHFNRIWFPSGVAAIRRRASMVKYGNRQYLTGGYTANLVIDEHLRCSRQGILAPDIAPSVSVGAGATDQIAYLRYYDEVTQERSPLSTGTSVTGNVTRAWTALPTTVPGEQIALQGVSTVLLGVVVGSGSSNFDSLRPGDRIARSADLTRWGRVRSISSPADMVIDDTGLTAAFAEALTALIVSRVSHVELWVSVSGALPRFILRVRLGVTGVVESTATLALGEAEVEPFTQLPTGTINLVYNKRQIISGVDGHPDTLYLSAIGFMERYEGLSFKTPYGEPIVGMFRHGDYVVVLCPESSYRLQGLSDEDYVLDILEPDIGGLGHHTNVRSRGRVFVTNLDGVSIFNGAFHPVIPTRQTELQKRMKANPVMFQEGFITVNPDDKTVQLYPNHTYDESGKVDPVLVGSYDSVGPDQSGSVIPPEWLNDTNTAPGGGLITFAKYMKLSGQKIGKFYRGDSTAKIWVDDDEEAFHGTSIVVLPHNLALDPGGNRREGKELVRFWSYVFSELTDWQVRIWFGDEHACPIAGPFTQGTFEGDSFADPVYSHDVVASELEGPVLGGGETTIYAAKIVHAHPVVEKSGRGWSIEYRFEEPLNVTFYGVGMVVGPGEIARKLTLKHAQEA